MRRAHAIVLCALLALCAETAHAGDQFYFINIIKNPGAEAGAASPDGQSVVLIPDWTVTGSATVVAYGTPGEFPGPADDGPHDRGANVFVGGPGLEQVVELTQEILVPSWEAPPIDNGYVVAEARGWFGGFGAQEDHAEARFDFLDGDGALLLTLQLGPVTASERGNLTSLRHGYAVAYVPAGTRRIVVTLEITRVDGPYNNAVADSLSLLLLIGLQAEASTWGRVKATYR